MRPFLATALLSVLPGIAAAHYLQVLPSEAVVRRALQDSPAIMAAREQTNIAAARQKQLDAGGYEWTLGATGQRRTDPQGFTYNEQSYELSRSLRLWGKAGLDKELGQQLRTVSENAFSDGWHEAGRMMLAEWFEWLRASRALTVLESQASLLEQQLATVRSRVRAGDAPRVEETLLQAEIDRHAAAVAAAQRQEKEAALMLQRHFPDLPLEAPRQLDLPEMPSRSEEEWVQLILADNHEIELADGLAEVARIAARRAGRDRLPDPTVGVRYSNNFDGNRRVVGLIFSVPLGGPARSAAFSAALGEASVAAQRSRESRLKVESDARRDTLSMRTSFAQWERLRRAAELSSSGAQAVAKGYSLGEFSITELLTARRQALDADLAAASAQLDALESVARLQLDAHEIWSWESTYKPVADTTAAPR